MDKIQVGVDKGQLTIDTSGGSFITVSNADQISLINLYAIANNTRTEWYYTVPGEEARGGVNKLSSLTPTSTGALIEVDPSLINTPLDASDNVMVIYSSEKQGYDIDINSLLTVDQNPEFENYSDPVELVATSDIGITDDTWLDQGSDIDVRTNNMMILYIDYTANDSSVAQLRVVMHRETGDTNDYVLPQTNDYVIDLDPFAGQPVAFPFEVTGMSYVQVQTKALDVVDPSVEGTVSIDYALANF